MLGADHILVGRYDECRRGDRGDQGVGSVGEARQHELSIEVEHALGVRRVTLAPIMPVCWWVMRT